MGHYSKDESEEIERGRDAYVEQQKWNSVYAVYNATYDAATQEGIDPINAESQAKFAAGEVQDSYGLGAQETNWGKGQVEAG